MTTIPKSISDSSAVARMLADRKQRAREQAEAAAVAQRWPIPLELRDHIIGCALEICGLEAKPDGSVQRIEGQPRPAPREKLAAMRVIASYDKISLEERKADLRDNPTDEPPPQPVPDMGEIPHEVATECLMILINEPDAKLKSPSPPPPKPRIDPGKQAMLDVVRRVREARWPISMEIRCALTTTAANLCGLAISPEGKVERIKPTAEAPAEPARIRLAALRVIARFDRLSIEHRRVERLRKPPKHGPPNRHEVDNETAVRFYNLIEEHRRKHAEG
jgi:hypothetical protein